MVELAEGRPPLWELEPTQVMIEVPRKPAPTLKDPYIFHSLIALHLQDHH